MQDVLVNRGALGETKLVPAATPQLDDGEALFRVDMFSLTANNVTYGAFGDFLKYWSFYPSPEEGWGRVPVWGFATVVESRSSVVKAGDRVYGYLPMSTVFKLKPGQPRHVAFADTSPHRAGLAPVYNNYIFNADDPLYAPDTEALQVLFRPLFATSFLIDDFVADNGNFGAKQVILSSASAKTAYAAARLMKARGEMKVIGLTSPGNLGYVKDLGFYDDVRTYDAIDDLDGAVPSVFIDIAGNTEVRAAVHRRFGDNLKYSCAVGATHWDAPRADARLAGPQPQMFFAPDILKKRMADWGAAEFHSRLAAAWTSFLPTAARTTRIVEANGLDAAARVFSDLASGKASPADGHVIRLG
jgi:NADPH:quinone reductase-like Zn-dependent oxidoreductase